MNRYTATTMTALVAALVVTNLPRPDLRQVAQFAKLYQHPEATLEWRDEWDWTMRAPIPGTDSLAVLRMGVCEQQVEPPAPSSGVTVNGRTLTIRGQGFGEHGAAFAAQPDLEYLPLGSTASQWGGGFRNGLSSAIQPSVRARADGSRYVHAECANGGYNSGMAVEFPPARRVYATWRVKFLPRTAGSNATPQWKVWRLNSTKDYNAAFNNYRGEMITSGNFYPGTWSRSLLYAQVWPMSPGNYPARCIAYDPGGGATACENEYLATYPNDAERWVRWEILATHSSAPGVRDGQLEINWVLAAGGAATAGIWSDGFSGLVTAEAGAAWTDAIPCKATRFVWQNFWGGSSSADASWEFEDIQVQTESFARVEVASSPSLSGAVDRRLCRVLSWSDGEIVAELPLGVTATGYVHVVLSDGAVMGPLQI